MRLTEFFDAMSEKLEENGPVKGHSWIGCTPGQMLRRLKQETGELERALKRGASSREVAREAADIANFAFFIADIVDRKTPIKEEGKS